MDRILSTQKFLAKNTVVVASILAISSILGFVRESAIAYKFGATAQTDAFFVAMTIPALFIGLIKNSITSTFITVYSGYMTTGQTDEGWRMTNILLSVLGVLLLGMIVVFSIGAPALVHLFAPGYTGEQLALTVELTRILLPSMFFGTLMGVLVGINNSNLSFIAPSLIGVVANVVTILSIFILGSVWGVYGLAVGSLLGIVAQFLIQLPSAFRHGLRFRFEIDFKDAGVRETMRLVAPFVLSVAAIQVNLIVNRTLATGLPEGYVSALYFADKLIFMPHYIFTVAVGMVVFPLLTRAAAQKNWGELIEGLQRSVRLLSLILLPAGLGIFLLRWPLVGLLYEHGAFTTESTRLTVETIGYFLGALYFGGLVGMVLNAFYALKKMKVAVGTSFVAVVVNIGLSLWFIAPLQQRGLALANSISSLVNLSLLTIGLYYVLRREGFEGDAFKGIPKFLTQLMLAVIGMSLAVVGYLSIVAEHFSGKGGLAITVFGAATVGIVVYGALVYWFKIEEVRKASTLIVSKVQGLRSGV